LDEAFIIFDLEKADVTEIDHGRIMSDQE